MEAAEEVARQLRLRDLGGLIVIDFIDMRENKHNSEVEKTLKNALKMDKARVNVGRISQFGIMEMSRQRIAKTLNDAIHLECPHCEGRGKVKSVEAMAVSFLRKVHAAAAKGTVAEVRGGLPLEVAYYLLNRKKRELTQIENDYEIEVTVKGKTSFLLNQLELETIKREKPHLEDVLKSEAEAEEAHKTVEPVDTTAAQSAAEGEQQDGLVAAEGGKKRKRRRKKKKPAAEGSTTSDLSETSEPAEPDSSPVEIAGEQDNADAASKPKKRKRRRGRKGAKGVDETAPSADFPAARSDAQEAILPDRSDESDSSETPVAAEKPKRARASRSKKKPAADLNEPASAAQKSSTEAAAGPVDEKVVPAAPKPRRRAAPKKATVVEVVPPLLEAAIEKPKPAPRARRKKKDAEIQ